MKKHKKIIRFWILLCCLVGFEKITHGQAKLRTPQDYLFCAAESGSDMAEGTYVLPWYLQKMTRPDFPILDDSGFYKDVLTGYGGAVFLDLRDSTIVISHFATESPSLKNMMDIVADVQLAGIDWVVSPLATVAGVVRDTQEAKEMVTFGLQYPSARKLYQMVRERWPRLMIENTGHSLGGSLAQLISYEHGIIGVTFDPAGIGLNVQLDTTKKENVRYITNYKIHHSLVSASVTTGLLIGKIITIYPFDGETILGTEAHGLVEIYNMAMNQETGYFRTLDEVAALIWRNGGYITELGIGERYRPVFIKKNVREEFDTYEAFKIYMHERYGSKTEMEYRAPVRQKPEKRLHKVLRLLRETDLLHMGSQMISND